MGRRPLMVRGLVIAVCGLLLGLGSCFGFLSTMDASEGLAMTLGAGFAIGLLIVVAGGIVFIIGLFKWFFGVVSPQPK